MCLARRNLSQKARRFLVLGNLSLCSGLLLTLFGKDFSHTHVDLYDGIRGLFIGLALSFIIAAFCFAKKCKPL